MHTLLIYLDQDEVVLVTLQQEFTSRDLNGQVRRLAYVDRRLQTFPHLRASDLPADVALLDIQPARTDCSYLSIDDDALRALRELEMRRAAEAALDGASAHQAVRDMKSAVDAIPAYVVAERERLKLSPAPEDAADRYRSWASPDSLALLQESHADIAARIKAASAVLDRYAVDPTSVETADLAEGGKPLPDETERSAPSGIWRRFYDRPRSAEVN